MQLTPDQNKAVTAMGSVAVTAGAGTGKTAMLAKRYAHHIFDHGLSPLEIVAVTFTDKAAAELRSRIREEIRNRGDEKNAAEVDAAQISTIHALAARVCRDFYHIAGIPADFSVMDETENEIRSVIWVREAISHIEHGIINELGYSWLVKALGELFKDPISAADAFKLGDSKWAVEITAASDEALLNLKNSDEWREAESFLREFRGASGDKLETVRGNVLNAMSDISEGRKIENAFEAFAGFRSNGGAQKNWPDGGLVEVRSCLVALRNCFNANKDKALLSAGPVETELAKRVELLKKAFDQTRERIYEFKLASKVLDYSDLEYYALKILETDEARQFYSDRWRAILVDEFQDTNPVQEKLLRQLNNGIRLTVVGDEKQSIYGFRRADVEIFGRFRKEIGSEVKLSKSFRTHEVLVTQMNSVFSVMMEELHQGLEAARTVSPDEGIPIRATVISGDKSENVYRLRRVESDYIAGEIKRMLDEEMQVYDKKLDLHRKITPGDIAILSRTRAPLDIYIESLLKLQIPAVNTGGGNLLETRTAKDALAVLAFAADTSNNIALVTLLRSPFFAVSDPILYRLSREKNEEQTWWSVLKNSHGETDHAAVTIERLLTDGKRCTPAELLELMDTLTGYTAVISNLSQGVRRMADWQGVLAMLRQFASLGRSDILGAARYVSQLIAADADIPRPPIDPGDAVALMTIHGSKGLEWPVVFVPDLARQKPNSYSIVKVDQDLGVAFDFEIEVVTGNAGLGIDEYEMAKPAILQLMKWRQASKALKEARRVLYVAITRARDMVFLTAAGKKGPDLDILLPGLELAEIPIVEIDAEEFRALHAHEANALAGDDKDLEGSVFQFDRINSVLTNIPVTALTEYAVCPLRFHYQFVDGHPGLGDGSSHGRTVGTLTHSALELELQTIDELKPFAEGAGDNLVEEAIGLARRFRSNEAFASVRASGNPREEAIKLRLGDVTVTGIVDLVGSDFILDYKTDSVMDPGHHRMQLWAYAKALQKEKAYIAYLRHDVLHEFGPEELSNISNEVSGIVKGIETANYEPSPSEKNCGRCVFQKICSSKTL